jgi:KDO2-lipid IV(A) lauroyltransferase
MDALSRSRIVGIVADIPFGEKGRRVTLAGTSAHLPLGPWAIAVRARATVMPAFIIRETPGRYRLIMHEPIVPGEGSFRRQMERMQDVYLGHLEHYLQRYPEQWGVLQPFWDELPA